MSRATRSDDEPRGGGRWLLWTAAIFVGLPLLMICGLSLARPPSPEAAVVSVAVLLMVIGGLIAPWRRDAAWAVRAGLLLLLSTLAYRFLEAESSTTIRSATGPEMSAGRWLDRLVPERDIALGASSLLRFSGQLTEPGLLSSLRDGYDRMRRAEGTVPSSVVSTFIMGQTPTDHTVFTVAPGGQLAPREAAVVFLHGCIGNVTLLCWQVAQAANPVGLDVICPSMQWESRWSGADGRAIVRATLERLRGQGVRRIYLAGLSAGSVGASLIARDVDIEGLILISGASPDARPARVPTLVLQGDLDTMTRPQPARSFAQRAGRVARYVHYEDASHWMILSHHEQVTDELRVWLAQREGLGSIHED